MKKFSIAMLSMVLAGSMLLTGCGGSKTADSSSDAQDNSTSTSDTADYKLATEGTLTMATNAYFEPGSTTTATRSLVSTRKLHRLSLTSWA